MKTIIIAALLASATAFATPPHHNPPPQENPSAEATAVAASQSTAVGVGLGVGVGVAHVDNDVSNVGINAQHQGQSLDNDIKNSNSNFGVNTQGQSLDNDIKNSNSNVGVNTSHNDNSNRNVNGQQQGQGQDQDQRQHQGQGQEQSATSDQSQSQEASANNTGNAQTTNITSTYKAVRNAPSFALASVYPTAGCQAGFSMGGSGVNGGGGIAFSLTKKECEAVVLAQNFAAIGMVDTSCDILKTTKAFQRAAKLVPSMNDLSCAPKVPAVVEQKVDITPDLSNYVKKDELAERDRRIIESVSKK